VIFSHCNRTSTSTYIWLRPTNGATLTGEQFEMAIEPTEGFSFAQLRETYILGSQSAFEHGRDVGVADVIEAIELQATGAQDLKTSVAAPGFVRHPKRSTSRK
jgi:hypothetical protein